MELLSLLALHDADAQILGFPVEFLWRLAMAAVAGALLGIERERHGRAAGLRTTLLVCLASCVAMILSDSFYTESFERQEAPSGWHPDPARLAAGLLSGMGFLGAGVIIRQRDHVIHGVTTAATLWFVTIIGLAFGAGAMGIGVVASVLSLVILILIPQFEARIKNDWYSEVGITSLPSKCSVRELVGVLEPLGVIIKAIDVDEEIDLGRSHVTLRIRYKRQELMDFTETIMASIRDLPGVIRVSFKS
jgi:putative Mg2+ transporter-C (MgtC) family protein